MTQLAVSSGVKPSDLQAAVKGLVTKDDMTTRDTTLATLSGERAYRVVFNGTDPTNQAQVDAAVAAANLPAEARVILLVVTTAT